MAVDHLRHNSKLLPTEDMTAYLADESDLERSYIKEERRILVHKVLGKLASDYRQILWLVFFEDLSHEASLIMHNSKNTLIL